MTRKHKAVSLQVKKAIVDAAIKNNNKSELAKHFDIPRETLVGILSDKEAILKAIDGGGSSKRARMQTGMHDEMEEALLVWIKQALSKNETVTGDLIKEKASEIAGLLNIEGFGASNGWLEGFKNRFSIKQLSKQGEAGAIDVGSLKEWQQQVLRTDLGKFDPNNIFNADETALFWQMLPNKTLAFKGDKCTGGKKSKERINVLVGANMTGFEKLSLLVIGKSANPRCLKNAVVPVDYIANKKAWMTRATFETWIKGWNNKLVKEGRKVLLYLDNCSAHPPRLALSNITIKFFPANTTSMSQPMDQGVIQNLKVHYRRFLLRERIKAFDAKKDFLFNLLNALHLIRKAWIEVKSSTIANCFRHAKFNADAPTEEEDETVDELLLAWARLQDLGGINEEAEVQDFMHVDDDVITDGALSLQEIVDETNQQADSEIMDVEEEAEADPEEPPVTSLEAMKAMDVVRRFAEKNFSDHNILKCSDKLEEEIYQYRMKNQRQKKLTDYFSFN